MAQVLRVVAPNPGPYTGPGTNTWIVGAGPVVVVIDPGPDDEAHLAALRKRLSGKTVGVVLVTHGHPDHLPLAERFASQFQATVLRHPELKGDVAAYLRSLDRLAAMQPRILFPGHWDPVTDAMGKIDEYRRHRLAREAQILAEVQRGGGTAAELTRRVYGELDEKLAVAAEMTLRAHLRKLVEDGDVREKAEVFEPSVI